MARRHTFVTLVAAVVLTAAATLTTPSAPAQAASCADGTGVNVLVDFGALGGGSAAGCGGDAVVASDAFKSAGFALTQHPRQQGFVCKVQGRPADGDCMGTDAYWGFFVSDEGKGWVYASLGVYQQAVDAGDSVALVWQCSRKQRQPGQTAACSSAASRPQPTKQSKPKAKPTKHVDLPANPTTPAAPKGTPRSTATSTSTAEPSATPSATSRTSATPSQVPSPTQSQSVGSTVTMEATLSASANSETTDATEPVASDSGGLPGWVPPVLVALLAVAAGGVAWVRRTR